MNRNILRLGWATIIVILALSAAVTTTTAAPHTFSCTSVTEIPQVECEALVALYNGTVGVYWWDDTNWLVSSKPSNWFGVTVAGGHVTRLSLPSNTLNGPIPSQLGSLAHLTYLNLGSNALNGSIPPELGNLTNLTYLGLNSNKLSSGIPPQLGSLANLTGLYLSYNQLSGSLPAELASLANLTELSFESNQLNGSIPTELSSLTNLTGLGLAVNNLSGPIPPELGSLLSLTTLSLSKNQLSGVIPAELGNLVNLTSLGLWSNQLSGAIPPELGSLTKLTMLLLDSNNLSGPVPPELGNLIQLTSLRLDSNDLSGPLPPQLANLTKISANKLNLNYNWFTVPNPYPSNPPTELDNFLMTHASGWELTQGIVADIPVTGGQMQSRDGRVVVTVPVGGVPERVRMVMTSLAAPRRSIGKLFFAKTSFKFGAYDAAGTPITPFSFAQPVTVTLTYLDNDVAGQDESQLRLYYWDTAAASWVDASQTCPGPSSYQRDLASNTLSVPVCHLTEFALLVKTTARISGQVAGDTNGLAGVIISAGNGDFAVTDASGNYTLSDLLYGTYTLTPSKAGYTFDPISQPVTLTNADQTGINFTGLAIALPEYKINLPIVSKQD